MLIFIGAVAYTALMSSLVYYNYIKGDKVDKPVETQSEREHRIIMEARSNRRFNEEWERKKKEERERKEREYEEKKRKRIEAFEKEEQRLRDRTPEQIEREYIADVSRMGPPY